MHSAESKVWFSSAGKQWVYKLGELGRMDEVRAMASISLEVEKIHGRAHSKLLTHSHRVHWESTRLSRDHCLGKDLRL